MLSKFLINDLKDNYLVKKKKKQALNLILNYLNAKRSFWIY